MDWTMEWTTGLDYWTNPDCGKTPSQVLMLIEAIYNKSLYAH